MTKQVCFKVDFVVIKPAESDAYVSCFSPPILITCFESIFPFFDPYISLPIFLTHSDTMATSKATVTDDDKK